MLELLAEELVAWLRESFPQMSEAQEAELLSRLLSFADEARSGGRAAFHRHLIERQQSSLFKPPATALDLSLLDPAVGQAKLAAWARDIRQTLGKARR